MKRFLYIIWITPAILFTGCFDKDIFPDTPNIALEDIYFVDGPNIGSSRAADTLVIKFSFEDGNGDLGIIKDQDILPPYHEFDVYLDSRDTVITEGNINEVVPPIYLAPLITQNFILLGISGNNIIVDQSDSDYPIFAFDKQFFSEDVADIPFACPGLANQEGVLLANTTLTPYVFGGNSSLIPSTDAQRINTTLPVVRVETHFNFIVEFQKKVGENFVPLNFQDIFQTELCDIGFFNGRIPLYDPEGNAGTITYAMQSALFRVAFVDDIIRLKFYVYDRAGNKSNEVFTPEFILADITQ
ncbi:hypothetical protein [Ekhidna sp.]|uniref:hypothetical protein n=1 Tax=Ekhidna sp. TaxID=2608089 RepID=UPI0032ED4C70